MPVNKKVKYSAGSCNIGPKEIRKRYLFGAVGFIISALLLIALFILNEPYPFFLTVIIPLFLGFIGFYQGFFKFCVVNAHAGIYDLSDVGGGKGNVKNKRFHELDLKRANILVLYAFLSALILSLLAVFIAYLAV